MQYRANDTFTNLFYFTSPPSPHVVLHRLLAMAENQETALNVHTVVTDLRNSRNYMVQTLVRHPCCQGLSGICCTMPSYKTQDLHAL